MKYRTRIGLSFGVIGVSLICYGAAALYQASSNQTNTPTTTVLGRTTPDTTPIIQARVASKEPSATTQNTLYGIFVQVTNTTKGRLEFSPPLHVFLSDGAAMYTPVADPRSTLEGAPIESQQDRSGIIYFELPSSVIDTDVRIHFMPSNGTATYSSILKSE